MGQIPRSTERISSLTIFSFLVPCMSDLKGFTDWLLTNRFFLVLFFYILCIGDIGVVL